MTLEEFKNEVVKLFKIYGVSDNKINKYMKLCEDDIVNAYNKGWEPIEIALPISMGL